MAGLQTLAIRSKRQRRAVPPSRLSTASIPSTSCACSSPSQKRARTLPEWESVPTSRCASPPQGASGSSSQSHWISSPGGWAISIVGLRDIDPASQALGTPGLIESDAELAYVYSKCAPVWEKRLDERGFVVLSWGDTGWGRIFVKREARTPSQLKGLKMFAWSGDPGANDLQNFPVVSSAVFNAGNLNLTLSVDSPSTGSMRIEVFAASGSGEGQTLLGSVCRTTPLSNDNFTIATTAKSDPEAKALLGAFRFPFRN